MQHMKARQRQHDGRWDYTTEWQGRISPIGYCHKFIDFDPTRDVVSPEQIEEHRASAHKYHTEGHATAEEAVDCYEEYLLDHYLHEADSQDEQRKCEVCGTWTTRQMHVRYTIAALCPEHATREEMKKRLHHSEVWES